MTRVFLAAGVAALAIATPATAQRGEQQPRERGAAKAERQGARQQVQQQRVERPRPEQRVERRAERPRMEQRVERAQARPERMERRVERAQARSERVERRVERAQIERPARVERQAENRIQNRVERRVENRVDNRLDRQAARAESRIENRVERRVENRMDARQQARMDRIDAIGGNVEQRIERARDRIEMRSAGQARRIAAFREAATEFPVMRSRGNGLIDGCPPGLWMKGNGCLPPGQAAKLIGAPIATVQAVSAFNTLPNSLRYLYPDTDDYYYRYGDGYLYQVDRGDNLIMSLIPLIAGGFIPGQYLPASYMSSYVPNYYGLSSFYPDSPYSCNRYYDGVVYQVDCATGMIEGIVPLYASGYGVGQILPSAYGYYNVPSQYRSLYYDNDDYGYWYAPGAIYQYDARTSLITSVAALLSPGFTIGQAMPMGYSTYNVPYDYRTQYYDTANDWYRYNNGYIYRVDPTTQLVTAIVASILT